MNALDVLVKARALVADGWCQGVCGYDAEGNEIAGATFNAGAAKPARRCAIAGLVEACAPENIDVGRGAFGVFMKTIDAFDQEDAIEWNNDPERTKDQVLAAFDEAIAKQRAVQAS